LYQNQQCHEQEYIAFEGHKEDTEKGEPPAFAGDVRISGTGQTSKTHAASCQSFIYP
jgi:hypothetical protein